MSTTRRIQQLVTTAALAAALGACATTVKKDDSDKRRDAVGDQPVAKIIQIDEKADATVDEDGTVRYRITNISDETQKNMTAFVTFYYPPSGEGGIKLEVEGDWSATEVVTLFPGESTEIEAVNPQFAARSEAGQTVLSTELTVELEVLVPIVARTETKGGTLFLDDSLECVGLSNEDLLLGMNGTAPELWIEFQNVSDEELSNLEVAVVFLDGMGQESVISTDKAMIPTLAPGQSEPVPIDVSGIADVSMRPYLVRVTRGKIVF